MSFQCLCFGASRFSFVFTLFITSKISRGVNLKFVIALEHRTGPAVNLNLLRTVQSLVLIKVPPGLKTGKQRKKGNRIRIAGVRLAAEYRARSAA